MTNKDAIKILEIAKPEVEWDYPMDYQIALDMAIKALKVQEHRYKQDKGKPKLSLVPTQILYDIAEVREYGLNKYPEGGKNNWKLVDNAKERYTDALLRHITAFVEEPTGKDPESHIEHLKHAACNIAFLCELYKRQNLYGLTADVIVIDESEK